MVVHTLSPLQAGEEVLISYFNILLPRNDRQARTVKWGFSCQCPICDEVSGVHAGGEKARKDIRELNALQARLMQSAHNSAKTLTAACERGETVITQTLDSSALYPALPDLYDGVGMLQAKILLGQKRELEREQVVASLKEAAIWDARITGPTSPATSNRLAKLSKFASRKDNVQDYRIERDANGEFKLV